MRMTECGAPGRLNFVWSRLPGLRLVTFAKPAFSVFPAPFFEVPIAVAALFPMSGDPMFTVLFAQPPAIDPHMPVAIPAPVAWCPGVTVPFGGNDDDTWLGRPDIDFDSGVGRKSSQR